MSSEEWSCKVIENIENRKKYTWVSKARLYTLSNKRGQREKTMMGIKLHDLVLIMNVDSFHQKVKAENIKLIKKYEGETRKMTKLLM